MVKSSPNLGRRPCGRGGPRTAFRAVEEEAAEKLLERRVGILEAMESLAETKAKAGRVADAKKQAIA